MKLPEEICRHFNDSVEKAKHSIDETPQLGIIMIGGNRALPIFLKKIATYFGKYFSVIGANMIEKMQVAENSSRHIFTTLSLHVGEDGFLSEEKIQELCANKEVFKSFIESLAKFEQELASSLAHRPGSSRDPGPEARVLLGTAPPPPTHSQPRENKKGFWQKAKDLAYGFVSDVYNIISGICTSVYSAIGSCFGFSKRRDSVDTRAAVGSATTLSREFEVQFREPSRSAMEPCEGEAPVFRGIVPPPPPPQLQGGGPSAWADFAGATQLLGGRSRSFDSR